MGAKRGKGRGSKQLSRNRLKTDCCWEIAGAIHTIVVCPYFPATSSRKRCPITAAAAWIRWWPEQISCDTDLKPYVAAVLIYSGRAAGTRAETKSIEARAKMIVSHEHKFIYIKNRKVAGSTVELALAQYCGERDIITVDPCKVPIARNYDQPYSLLKQIISIPHPVEVVRTVRDWRKRSAFYTHIDARSVRAKLGKTVWDSYFKFCFERNPWDKCVSFFYWQNRRHLQDVDADPCRSFKDYMRSDTLFSDRHFPSDWRRYAVKGSVIVDFVGQYNSLHDDMQKVFSEIGVRGQLQKSDKTNVRSEQSRDLSNMYDEELDGIVRKRFAREIRHFNYKRPF